MALNLANQLVEQWASSLGVKSAEMKENLKVDM